MRGDWVEIRRSDITLQEKLGEGAFGEAYKGLVRMDEIVAYDHSNESYWAVFSCGTVLYAIRGELAICGRNPSYDHFNCTLLSYVSY